MKNLEKIKELRFPGFSAIGLIGSTIISGVAGYVSYSYINSAIQTNPISQKDIGIGVLSGILSLVYASGAIGEAYEGIKLCCKKIKKK